MGLFRWLMVPQDLVSLEEMRVLPRWGLLEVRGRSVRVLRKAEPQHGYNAKEEVGLLVQAVANAQLCAGRDLNEWFACEDTPLGRLRALRRKEGERQRQTDRERECGRIIGKKPDGSLIFCETKTATGHHNCSEHGGRTRGEKRRQATVAAEHEARKETRETHHL